MQSTPTQTSDSPQPRLIRFGIFEADLNAGELRKSGSRIRLQEQPFQILAMLLERPGQIITREELRSRLWPGRTAGGPLRRCRRKRHKSVWSIAVHALSVNFGSANGDVRESTAN